VGSLFPEPLDPEPTEATVEIGPDLPVPVWEDQPEFRPPERPPSRKRRPPRRTLWGDVRRLAGSVRRRVAILSPDMPRGQRIFRATLAALLLAAVVVFGSVGGRSDPAGAKAAGQEAGAAEQTAPAAAPGFRLKPGKPLRLGDTGPRVKKLQKALVLVGLDPGKTDGAFGDRTAGAVAAFQTSRNLPATGVVDRRTVKQINEVLARPS
jgi:hypothetical protein